MERRKSIDLLKHGFILAVVLVISWGIVLRLFGLGDDSLWLDESISAVATRQISEHGVPVFESGAVYSRSFLFHYMMAGSFLFGIDDFHARLISVIFGVLTCVLAYFIGKEYNKETALISLAFCSFLEIFIVYSRQARMYQMEMFFFFLALYLLYKAFKDIRMLKYSAISAIVAYDTHPIALLLLPFFAYYFIKRNPGRWAWISLIAICSYVAWASFSLLDEFSYERMDAYIGFLKMYAPFLLVALVGLFVSAKRRLTWLLAFSFVFIVGSASFGKIFAFRYVYLGFLPLVILAAHAISNVKWNLAVAAVYIVWVSNIFYPLGNITMLLPTSQISHYDFTAPTADFKGIYSGMNASNLITSIPSEAAWYYKNPDYWIYISYTGEVLPLNESWSILDGKDIYTGADVVASYEEFLNVSDGSTVVIDDWSATRMDEGIYAYIISNCTVLKEAEGIRSYGC